MRFIIWQGRAGYLANHRPTLQARPEGVPPPHNTIGPLAVVTASRSSDAIRKYKDRCKKRFRDYYRRELTQLTQPWGAPMDIREYMKRLNVQVDVVFLSGKGKYRARLLQAGIREAGVLVYPVGEGNTSEEAITELAFKVRGRDLEVRPMTKERYCVSLPASLEGPNSTRTPTGHVQHVQERSVSLILEDPSNPSKATEYSVIHIDLTDMCPLVETKEGKRFELFLSSSKLDQSGAWRIRRVSSRLGNLLDFLPRVAVELPPIGRPD